MKRGSYQFQEIERRWRERWLEEKTFKTHGPGEDRTTDTRPKCYVLDMFPYPSGDGLHIGHPKGYIASDIYSRFKRMRGFNVLHPMGFDSFGLPAEQYAIANNVPSVHGDTRVYRPHAQTAAIPGPGLRLGSGAGNFGRGILPLDPVDLSPTLRLLVRSGSCSVGRGRSRHQGQGCADPGVGRGFCLWTSCPFRPRSRNPCLIFRKADRKRFKSRLVRTDRGRAGRGAEQLPAGVSERGNRQLVPRAGNGSGQRGGYWRRAQRDRRLPGIQAAAEAVDAPDHRLCRPPVARSGFSGSARRTRRQVRTGLAGTDQADAA